MTKKYNLGDLRAAIESTVRAVAEESECGEAPNDRVLARLKSERGTLVNHFAPQLIDMALTKLLNDVCKTRVSSLSLEENNDLFAGYGKIPKIVTITRGTKKDTANLTVCEARQWLERHSDRLVESDHADFRKLFERIESNARSDNEIISDILQRMSQPEVAESRELLPAG